MLVGTQVVGPFQCNCRLIVCPQTGEAALIDPGDEGASLMKWVVATRTPSGEPIRLRYLLHTHAHLDHVGATSALKRAFGAPIVLHKMDDPLYQNLVSQGAMFGLRYEAPEPVDHYLQDGEEIAIGKLQLHVLHTPGHSPGSICLRMREDSTLGTTEALFTGDTLFKGSVGRTDLWGGDNEQLRKSIRQRLLVLEDDLPICPGHGPDSTIGFERAQNPFLR